MAEALEYTYRATVGRIVDGDTVDVVVDLGFYVSLNLRFRLAGLDAPETRGAKASDAGRASAIYLEWLIPVGSNVVVRSKKTGKYGRWIASIWPVGELSLTWETTINARLISDGHAEYRADWR